MSGRVVAVLGISGVGKTTMVSTFTLQHPWAHCVRASTLLKEAAAASSTEALRTVPAADIYANQDRLTLAFANLRQQHANRHIILDGHNVIDNEQGLVVVPAQIFCKISPCLIVFLEDDAKLIHGRRLADLGRSRHHRSVEEISAYQNTARKVAFDYGATLSIPCAAIRSGDTLTFSTALKQAFGQHD